MQKLITTIILIVLMVGGFFLMDSLRNRDEDATDSSPEIQQEVTEGPSDVAMEMTTDDEEALTPEQIADRPNTLVANLEDVSGGNSSGLGYVLRQDGKLYHYVTSNLPDPSGTNLYEGWLVKQEPSLEFFSTGVMTKNESGEYVLSYEQNEESLDFNFVVITEETVIDETPEVHVIEGLAQ